MARWMEEAAAHSVVLEASQMGIVTLPHRHFSLQSVCIPLHTARETALALVTKGRGNIRYDEP
jgi:hypothetical protein